jgi:hypothetical protein
MMRSGEVKERSSSRAGPSCPTRLQQMQPLRSSRTPEMEAEDASWESTARSPNSFFKRASCGAAQVSSVIILGDGQTNSVRFWELGNEI